MAADPTLVRGAYMAAGGGIDYGQSEQIWAKVSQGAFGILNKLVKERSDAFKDHMKWELERDPGLNEAERRDLFQELQGKRKDYIFGSEEDRAMIMTELADN